MALPGIKIALVSTGLSHVNRGYETFILDLYEALKDVATVSLFKGSGWSAPPDVYQIPCLRRDHPWAVRLASQEHQRYRYEQISMAFSGWMQKHWQQYAIIHFCDPAFGGSLLKLRKLFGYDYKLLFANCGPSEPEDYRRFDHIQEFTPMFFDKARTTMRKSRLSLIPMGVWPQRFRLDADKHLLRDEWGIPRDKFAILSVASLDEPYKRLPFLIETVAAMNDERLFLVLAGQNQDTDCARETLALAEAKLPGRHHHLTAPYLRIPELYNACDLFIMPSLLEGFGKVYLEAMASGIPMLCHEVDNTRWIVPSEESRVDMEDQTALIRAIGLMRDESGLKQSDYALKMADWNSRQTEARFHWTALRDDYLSMYEQMLVLPE